MQMQFTHKGYEYTIFFVLNGLINGEEGVYAQKTGTGEQLKDGWYYLLGDDVDGDGPYDHREEAQHYAQSQVDAEDHQRMEDEFGEFVARLKARGFTEDELADAFAKVYHG